MSKHTPGAIAAKKIMEEVPIISSANRCEVAGGPNPNAEVKPQSLRDIIWDRHESLKVEQEITAIITKETAAEIDLLKAQKKHLNIRCSDLWDYAKELEAERDRLREACKELIKSILEDWGISMRYKAIKNAEAALAEPESEEKEETHES